MQSFLKPRKPKKKKSLPALFAALAVLLVLLAGLLYARPVDAYGLSSGLTPEMTERVHWVVSRYGSDGSQTRDADDGGPDAKLLSLLGELRFHRSLLNPLRPYLGGGTAHGYEIQEGDVDVSLHLYGAGGETLSLSLLTSGGQFVWRYDGLPCTLSSDQETAQALLDYLWETAEPIQSNS